MLGMAVLTHYLAVPIAGRILNFVGTFTIYLVATAWMPLRAVGDFELSGGDRIEAFLFVPQLSSLGVLIFWMIRVRFTGWYKDLAPN